MSTFKRISVIIFAVIIISANLPLCASAVDPVSAATMANAMAQAITAYGASQGVSMTFDVTDTDGIGEGVHELWDQFKEEVNDPNTPSYDSLAVTMWSNLYSKIGNNLGINISASEMPFIDSFWNWILSGPAEMQKVDDSYSWTINSSTGTVDPIHINSIGELVINGKNLVQTTNIIVETYNRNGDRLTQRKYVFSQPVYAYQAVLQPSSTYLQPVAMFDNTFIVTVYSTNYSNNTTTQETLLYSDIPKNSYGSYYYWTLQSESLEATGSFVDQNNVYSPIIYDLPYYYNLSDRRSVPEAIFGAASTAEMSIDNASISVRPYIGDTVPQNVYIPDNTDVNYSPTDVAIPLDIPWDNTLFGDGDGILTDAQSAAAAHAADDAIADSVEKTLTIADTENPEVPAPGEVYVPFLPVTLPNFNFNLSGIWHYVREWISSLGAWFATVLTVWASLPYAMVVPVYATLVVVIVLGVYKRFFM